MFYVLLLSLLVVSLPPLQAELDEDGVVIVEEHKCTQILRLVFTCCKTRFPIVFSTSDGVSECLASQNRLPSCDMPMCIARTEGLVFANDTINKKAMAARMSYEFRSNQRLAKNIIHTCINEEVSHYGSPDFCPIVKMLLCAQIEIGKTCDEFNDGGACTGIYKMLKQCSEKPE